jgi:phospholipid/cholesterol/gamma-HCH transport system permease protein
MSASSARLSPPWLTGSLARALDWLGARSIAAVSEVLQVATLVGYAGWRLTVGLARERPVSRQVLVRQILFTGVEALPFTALLATLIGIGVVVQAGLNLMGSGQAALLGRLLVVVVVRELGPLVAGLIVIARSGTAMVVEMGNMRVGGEIEALEGLGIDPFDYLVVPRLGGMVASWVGLSLYFVACSLLMGLLAANLVSAQAPSLGEFVVILGEHLSGMDIVAFSAKTVVPALAVAAIACLQGLRAGPAVTDVPRAATRATVASIGALFVWNVLVSTVVYLS